MWKETQKELGIATVLIAVVLILLAFVTPGNKKEASRLGREHYATADFWYWEAVSAWVNSYPHNTDNENNEVDIWHTMSNGEFKVEWRHINSSEDTMAVIHIHQGDSLYTWIGKPCQCY